MEALSPNDYVGQTLTPTLKQGLVALCKARPEDPRTWLAEWLLANKPAPTLAAAGTAAAVQAVIDMYATPEGKAKLRELWTTLDKDGNGTISSKEWGKGVSANWKAMSSFFGGCTKAEVGKVFKTIDIDGSGDLTWEEFEGASALLGPAQPHVVRVPPCPLHPSPDADRALVAWQSRAWMHRCASRLRSSRSRVRWS